MSKVSRERVGIELEKMITGASAALCSPDLRDGPPMVTTGHTTFQRAWSGPAIWQ